MTEETNTISLRDRQWVDAWPLEKASIMKAIFSAYYQPLWVTAFRMLADRSLAEDMVQEVMGKMWEMERLDHIRSNMGGYLHRSVVNHSLNKIKERKRWALQEEADMPDTRQSMSTSTQQSIQKDIEQAISGLPDRCRLVFVMSRYELLSNQEIADLLEISIKTVENQMTKAFRLLRENLSHLQK
ncbi:MAG: sigma-70 family RNA polymerase sigma factor [Saprospiraceae bacterium]|nr:sigma-70 family RNA polymerase sigma factor [Saprospiraceae bacterium]